jgi:hypothetical protein
MRFYGILRLIRRRGRRNMESKPMKLLEHTAIHFLLVSIMISANLLYASSIVNESIFNNSKQSDLSSKTLEIQDLY